MFTARWGPGKISLVVQGSNFLLIPHPGHLSFLPQNIWGIWGIRFGKEKAGKQFFQGLVICHSLLLTWRKQIRLSGCISTSVKHHLSHHVPCWCECYFPKNQRMKRGSWFLEDISTYFFNQGKQINTKKILNAPCVYFPWANSISLACFGCITLELQSKMNSRFLWSKWYLGYEAILVKTLILVLLPTVPGP